MRPFVPDPHLKWDIFVSYSHADNGDGWVERFHKQLSVGLDQRGGRVGEVQIWRDPQIDEATIFDDVIRKRVEQSAVFLALCSIGYRRSAYCRKEFETFRQRFGDAGLRVGDRSRIVRVRLHNIPYADLPGTADRTGAFDFFAAEGRDDIGTPLETESADFRSRVSRLSKILFQILEDMKKALEDAREPEPVGEVPAKGEVFLAEVCDSLRNVRGRLAADLAARAVSVGPGLPPPFVAAEHENAVRSALESCKLGVHLFDAWGDNPIQGRGDATYGREQLRLVGERKLPQIVWLSQRVRVGQAATESMDAAWLRFLNELEGARREEGQYEIVRCPPSELASLVAARIRDLRQSSPAPGGKPAVLLDTHEKDHLVAFDVCKALLTSGIRPDLLAQEDDPRQNTTLFAERLKKAQGLMVLFGKASEDWVRARLGEALKLMVTAHVGLKFCGVLLAPPDEGKSQASFEHPLFKTQVLDIRQGLNADTLGPVLQGLGLG
jgi:hypothetical protein